MSVIDRVETFPVRAKLRSRFVTALRSTDVVETLAVRVTDTDGAFGWGEAPQVWRVTGESLAGAAEAINGPLANVLVGSAVGEVASTTRALAHAVVGNRGAVGALDVALHDLAARRRGESLAGYLGTGLDRVPTGVTLSAAETEPLVAAALARVNDGFEVLKLKVGARGVSDVVNVAAVRDAVGPDITLRLDANQGWTPRKALELLEAMAPLRLECVEQPVPAHDVAALAWVRARSPVPIMADEAVFGLRDLVELIRLEAADAVNIKLAKCGGLSPALAMLTLAHEYGLDTMVGTMMETHIGVGAAACLAAAAGTTMVPDLDAAWWCARPPYEGGLHYEGASVVLPQSLGSSITRLL